MQDDNRVWALTTGVFEYEILLNIRIDRSVSLADYGDAGMIPRYPIQCSSIIFR